VLFSCIDQQKRDNASVRHVGKRATQPAAVRSRLPRYISSIGLTVVAKQKTFFFLGLAALLLLVGSGSVSAEPSNPSLRSLNKMARKGDPLVSILALAEVCPTVKTVTGSEFLWKSEISDHISPSDRRAAGPTFICNKVCPKKWPMNVYYSDGVRAARLGYYSTYRVTGKARAYCATKGAPACSIKTIATDSKAAGRDGYVYLKTSDSTCYKVPPLGRTGRP